MENIYQKKISRTDVRKETPNSTTTAVSNTAYATIIITLKFFIRSEHIDKGVRILLYWRDFSN